MNAMITPVYLLPNKLASYLLHSITGISNSDDLTMDEQAELTCQLINEYGYTELLRTYFIEVSLDIKFLQYHKDDLGFDLIPLLRTENKDKVFELITILNEDPKINYELARYQSGLYSPFELVTENPIPPQYEKLTEHKQITESLAQAEYQQSFLKNNPSTFDDLGEANQHNIYAPEHQNHSAESAETSPLKEQ